MPSVASAEATDGTLLKSANAVRRARTRVAKLAYLFAASSFVAACPAAIALSAALQGMVPERAIGLLSFAVFIVPLLSLVFGLNENKGHAFGVGASVERDGSLNLGDEARTRIAREDISSGYSTPDGVAIETRSGVRYLLQLPKAESAAWLDTLGLGAGNKLFRARFHRVFNQIMFWMVVSPTIITIAARLTLEVENSVRSGIAGFVAGLMVALFASLRWMGSAVVVGADGLTTRDGLLTKFFPYSTIARVSVENQHLVLDLVDKRTARVWADGDYGTDLPVLVQRIEEARALFAKGGGRHAGAQLAREGRSIVEWREGLARLLGRKGGYREVGLDPDVLVRVLSDASAPVEHRVAAALALGTDERHRERVRVVTAALADERVRVALESAAEGKLDEDQYERAVENDRVRVEAS